MEKDLTFEILVEEFNKINRSRLTLKNLKREKIRKEFACWLQERMKYGYRYLDFLCEMNEHILERTTAEVGKTEYDSLVLPFDTTIISPYEFKELDDRERLINSKFMVYEEKPVLYFDRQEQPTPVVIQEQGINTFMTQNPYSPYSTLYWHDLHNSGHFDIAVGIYGSIYDRNIREKLIIMKNLKEKIIGDDYKYDFNCDGDIYFAALVSDRKIKKMK